MSNDELILIRLDEVLRLTTLSRSTWYEGVRAGKYPAARQVSERRVAWDKREVLDAVLGPASIAK